MVKIYEAPDSIQSEIEASGDQYQVYPFSIILSIIKSDIFSSEP